jgi:dolichol-phosphate mannosyltransferase
MPESRDKLLSVIVPTYNESANIAALLTRLLDTREPREIVVVDDSSPDGTADIVRDQFGKDARVRLIVRSSDRGLANSVRAGLEAASGDCMVVMDSDFNHDPEVVETMRALLEHFDIVVGSRFVAGGGMEDRFRYYCSLVYNQWVRTLLGTRIQDNLSGFFAIRRGALERMQADRIFFGYGDYFFRLLSQAADLGLPMVEIPVFYKLRHGGESKTKYFQVLGQYSRAVVALIAKEGLKSRKIAMIRPRRPSNDASRSSARKTVPPPR